jgi:hypothetical protein
MTWNRLEMKPSRRRLLVRLKILGVVPGGCWLILVSPQIGLRGSLEAQNSSLRNDGQLLCCIERCSVGFV